MSTAAQPAWRVHRKWLEELYDVRSKTVHKGTPAGRRWGWAVAEHLVVAAHVFPLAVKLLFEQGGHYKMTDADRVRCLAVDPILAETQWVDPRDAEDTGRSWQDIVSKKTSDVSWERVIERIRKEHPEFFADGLDASAADGSAS